MKGKSLRFIAPMFVFCVVGLAAAAIIGYQNMAERQQMRESNRQNLNDVMLQTQRAMERFIMQDDIELMRNDLLALGLINQVRLAAIISPEGDILFATRSDLSGDMAVRGIPDFNYSISQLAESRYEPHIELRAPYYHALN